MARGFYTVIVGTQPGIYTDWTQAALRVSEISGAIFKKYKTYPDALEAFNNAARNGKVRAVQVDLEPEAESPPDSRVREQPPHEYAVVRPILHSVPRPGQSFHRGRATRSTGGGMMPSESMYASQSGLAERIGHRPIGTEPREYQSFDQPPRPADGVQAVLRAGSPSRWHDNQTWQESQCDSVRPLPILTRADRGTAIAHHEARPPSTSAEPERRQLVLESPSAALSWSPQPGPSTLRTFLSPLMEDNRFRVPENIARQHDRPLNASPLASVRPGDVGSKSSNGFSFNLPTTPLVSRPLYVEPRHASSSQGPIVNPVGSPRAHTHSMSDRKGKRRAQSPDAYIGDSFNRSDIRRSAPSPQTGMMETSDSLAPPGPLLRSSSPCSFISVTSSDETLSVFSFEVNIPAAGETSGLPGRSAHVASSPPPQLAGQPTVPHFVASRLVESAIPDLSAQSQERLNEEDQDRDDTWDLQVPTDDARLGNLGDVVDPSERTDSPRADLSVLFDDSPTLTRLLSPSKITSTSQASTHLPTQSIRPSGLDTTTSSPPRMWPLWPPSLSSHGDPEASRSTEVTGLGLSIEDVMSTSPPSHTLQQRTTTEAPAGNPPHRRVGSIEEQSPTRHVTSPWDTPAPSPQAQESPPYLRSALSNFTQQSRGATSTNNAAPSNSPRNIPLPSSPTASTTSGSSTQLRLQTLQAQPSHRSSPHMPFYPSPAVDQEDTQQQQRTLLSPSSLDVPLGFAFGFGRPTPHPSPVREPALTPAPAPAVIRAPSPSADPRSPISRLTRIPGSIIMGLSRNFLFGRPTGTPLQGTATRMSE